MTLPQEFDDIMRPALLQSMKAMLWTTTPPTEPGWYWGCDGARESKPWVVFIDGSGYVIMPGFIHKGAAPYFTHFLGPLTVPAPPQEQP